jgi:hypothetical protein
VVAVMPPSCQSSWQELADPHAPTKTTE